MSQYSLGTIILALLNCILHPGPGPVSVDNYACLGLELSVLYSIDPVVRAGPSTCEGPLFRIQGLGFRRRPQWEGPRFRV